MHGAVSLLKIRMTVDGCNANLSRPKQLMGKAYRKGGIPSVQLGSTMDTTTDMPPDPWFFLGSCHCAIRYWSRPKALS